MITMPRVLYRVEDHIAYISLNNPQSLNSITYEMVLALEKIWRDVRDNTDVWVVILAGEGKSFCSGADVSSMDRSAWKVKTHSFLMGEHRAGPLYHNVFKPIIVAVQRHVYGMGIAFVMESDICIAADDALFGFPEAKLNVSTIVAPFIGRFLPHSVTSEMLYTAKPIPAERAYQLGLCNKVVAREDLMKEAVTMARGICENGPLANFATKELVQRGRGLDYDSMIPLIEKLHEPVMNSEDGKEAISAFAQKRKPVWKLR